MWGFTGKVKETVERIPGFNYLESKIKALKMPSVSGVITNTRTIVEIVILIIVVVAIGKYELTRRDLSQQNQTLQQSLQQANLSIGLGQTRLGDAEAKVKDLDKKFQDEVKKLNAQVTAYSNLEALYTASNHGSGTVVVNNGSYSGSYNDLRLHIDYILTPPEKMEITYQLNLKLRGQMVQTIDKNGVIRDLFHLYEIDKDGKDIGELQLTKYEITIANENTTPRFIWNAPKLSANMFLGATSSNGFGQGAAVGYSICAYGFNINNLIWRFPELTLDLVNKNPGIGLSPASYNIGRHLFNITNDIWIAPHISLGLGNGSLGVTLGTLL